MRYARKSTVASQFDWLEKPRSSIDEVFVDVRVRSVAEAPPTALDVGTIQRKLYYQGWAVFLILDRIDWKILSDEARRQQRNREVQNPTISLFRWWARRSHAVFGALLDAAAQEFDEIRFLVSDPFSGGGTTAIEADRRGLDIYAQDIQPWAAVGLHIALDRVDSAQLEVAGTRLLERLVDLRKNCYGTSCPVHGNQSEIIHTYWVRVVVCPECGMEVFLYPHNLLTYSERVEKKVGDETAFFGCAYCGSVSSGNRNNQTQVCPVCGKVGIDSVVNGGHVACPHCHYSGAPGRFIYNLGSEWRPVLVQRLCNSGTSKVLHFDTPTPKECAQASLELDVPDNSPLCELIPVGKETRRLLEWGLTRWLDLYPRRQLLVYLRAAEELAQMHELSSTIRNRLLLALCGAAGMAGFSSRWDRFHLKAF